VKHSPPLCCPELLWAVVFTLMAATAVPAQPAQTAAPAATSQGVPNALQGFSQNRNEPVKIVSNTLEVRDKDKVATFLGDVHLVQGDTTMTCQSLVVFYDQNAMPGGSVQAVPAAHGPGNGPVQATPAGPGGQQQIRRLEAKGGVIVSQKDQTATGNSGVFDMKSNTVTLIGNVVVTQGQNVVRGDRLSVDLTSGVSRVEAGKSTHGRVEAQILPGSQPGSQPGGQPHDPKAAASATGKDAPKPPSAPLRLN